MFANGGRGRLTRNVAGITMDFDNLEDVVVRALGSTDKITVDDLRGYRRQQRRPRARSSLGGGDAAADS